MRNACETINVFQTAALTAGGITQFSKEFSAHLGRAWHIMLLSINIVFTVGTGTTAISEGELQVIKDVELKTDVDGVCHKMPGRAGFKLAQIKNSVPPYKDAIAAASATYRVCYPIFFINPFLNNPWDTFLDCRRYNEVTLQITTGTVADLLTTVGSSSVTFTCDCDLIKLKGAIPQGVVPLAYPYQVALPQVNPTAQQYLELPKQPDLGLILCGLHAVTGGVAGSPFWGVSADTVITSLNVEDDEGYPHKDRPEHLVRFDNKEDFCFTTAFTGWYVFGLARERSIMGIYPTGNRSKCRMSWTNATLSTSFIGGFIDGIKTFKR